MRIIELLRKLGDILVSKQEQLFLYDVEKQRKYIKKLGTPRNEIERSYFQYKCQMKFNGYLLTFFLNIFSLPVVIYFLIKKNVGIKSIEKKDAVFFRDGKPRNILPNILRNDYTNIEENPKEGTVLTDFDKQFIKKIMSRYPFSWLFILKCVIKIGRYSCTIAEYSPDAIIVCAEYSYTSSALTAYCRERNILHIDVMHGEKLFYMRDSFFEYDKCYIWDEHYAKLFKELGADERQFVISIPPSLKFVTEKSGIKIYDYTYYLAAEDRTTLLKIAYSLQKLKNMGKKVGIRPHPRYSDIEMVNKIFCNFNIEKPQEITIEESLLQTGNAISLYSTVLNQAICNSVGIVIDDVSNPIKFEKLQQMEYICINKKHTLLSSIINEEK